jgi:hypothetical protein
LGKDRAETFPRRYGHVACAKSRSGRDSEHIRKKTVALSASEAHLAMREAAASCGALSARAVVLEALGN